MNDAKDTGLCSTREVAERLGIHHLSVCRIIRQGRLRAQKIGRSWVVYKADLEELAQCYEPRRGPRRKLFDQSRRMR